MKEKIVIPQVAPKKLSISDCTKGTHYKMTIPLKVERKIRQLCAQLPDNEWSGILFYDYEGTFEDNNLVIKCLDFLLMDIGSSAYTEFNDSRDTLEYAEKHPELYEHLHMQGLIHSHDRMPTFFSGTDISTLQEWGAEKNNFVSLIVNNDGTYTAAITRKVSYTRQIKETFFTKFFGTGEKEGNKEYTENLQEKIEYYFLDIEKEEDEDTIETRERLEEIRNKKLEEAKKTNLATTNKKNPKESAFNINTSLRYQSGYPKDKKDNINYKGLFDDPYLGSDYDLDDLPFDYKGTKSSPKDLYLNADDIDYSDVCDPTIIQNLLLQLLTCSPLLNKDSHLDLKKWIKSMPNLYTKRFGKPQGKEASEDFKVWAEWYVEYLIVNTTDPDLEILGYSEDEIHAIIASNLIDKLEDLKPKNIYIDTYIQELETFMLYD